MHVMQKANRQISTAAKAPPPATPMMIYVSSRLSITLPPGIVAALATCYGKKEESNLETYDIVTVASNL
jgi:hypothetical protein